MMRRELDLVSTAHAITIACSREVPHIIFGHHSRLDQKVELFCCKRDCLQTLRGCARLRTNVEFSSTLISLVLLSICKTREQCADMQRQMFIEAVKKVRAELLNKKNTGASGPLKFWSLLSSIHRKWHNFEQHSKIRSKI